MNESKNNGYIIIIVLATLIYPILIYATFKFNEKDSGPFGDTMGGITAPLIGLLSAFLVYKAFQAQIKANRLAQKQFKKQEEQFREAFNQQVEANRLAQEQFKKQEEQFAIQSFNDILSRLIENYRKNVEKVEIITAEDLNEYDKPIVETFAGTSKIEMLYRFFRDNVNHTIGHPPNKRFPYWTIKKGRSREVITQSMVLEQLGLMKENTEQSTKLREYDTEKYWNTISKAKLYMVNRTNEMCKIYIILRSHSYNTFSIIEFTLGKIHNTTEPSIKEYYEDILYWLFWNSLSLEEKKLMMYGSVIYYGKLRNEERSWEVIQFFFKLIDKRDNKILELPKMDISIFDKIINDFLTKDPTKPIEEA